MKNTFYLFLLWFVFIFDISAQTKSASSWPTNMPWWKQNNLRVIQTNLPAYEAATLNPDSLLKDLEACSANTLLINAGGIMAFYPTKLSFHYTNPYMKGNMLADVIQRCHQRGIKVIVRFDFSRVHESKSPSRLVLHFTQRRTYHKYRYVCGIYQCALCTRLRF